MALTPLSVDEGATTRWLRLKLPKPLSPRTTISSSYKVFNPEDGSFIWCASAAAVWPRPQRASESKRERESERTNLRESQ